MSQKNTVDRKTDEELVRDFIVCVEFVRGRDGRREWWVFVHVDEGASAAQSAEASRGGLAWSVRLNLILQMNLMIHEYNSEWF